MRKLERLGVSEAVVGLVVPTGYSFNLCGTNIYMTLALLFLANRRLGISTGFEDACALVLRVPYFRRPALADRWEMAPDGKTYTFFLHKGVKWHDGEDLTAADKKGDGSGPVVGANRAIDGRGTAKFRNNHQDCFFPDRAELRFKGGNGLI